MSSEPTVLGALKHAARAFFKHDVSLHRDDDGVRLVFQDRALPATPRPPSRAEVAAKKDQQDLELARNELAALLDDNAALRSTMRHLAFVEHALEKKGWRALHKVPLDVLQKALEQFESLVTNWSPAGLACLRSKMAVAVIDREHQDPAVETDAFHTQTAASLENAPALAAKAIENAKASSADAPAEADAAAGDDEALLRAAYAAINIAGADTDAGDGIELQGELGSPSAKALARTARSTF